MKNQITKLNLGSGIIYIDGWINADLGDVDYRGYKIKVDVKCDLNKFPYPFKSNQFEYVLMRQTLPYIKYMDKTIQELNRIMKIGGTLEIKVAHFSNWGCYSEPNVINHFCLNAVNLFVLFKYNGFELISKRFTTHNKFLTYFYNLLNLSNWAQKMYERFFVYIFPAQEITWIFEKIRTGKKSIALGEKIW